MLLQNYIPSYKWVNAELSKLMLTTQKIKMKDCLIDKINGAAVNEFQCGELKQKGKLNFSQIFLQLLNLRI